MTEPNMTATPARTSTLLSNLASVTARISTASASASASANTNKKVRLIAVSKLKPASDVLALHTSPTQATGHTHFGENYLQELLEKSRLLPRSIKWHFIGGLQSNKCVTLARDVRGLWAVESVDSEKKASLLNKGWGERSEEEILASKARAETEAEAEAASEDAAPSSSSSTSGSDTKQADSRLRIYVQVNTSGEENKSGIAPDQAPALARYIREKCPGLKLQGVMTIGAIARSRATTAENENEDFVTLREARDRIVRELGLTGDEALLELSMGMSSDFEGAIALGSDQVRVGTTIFGDRPPKNEARVV